MVPDSYVPSLPMISIGSVDGKIKSVDVVPCPTEPCHLVHGTNVSLTVEFDSAVDTHRAITKIHGIILGLPVPFPFSHDDACKYHNVPCPIQQGSSYTYSNVLEVLSAYPKMSLVT
ncbi:hypothetical protein KUTeg_013176 [Tegillarca granosa]|uniref:MD-2-related lipid-recognition domain-containing protein n=1 Tax=Tegillarca granosa TaxID=220873 RepID=A0ABQ9ESY6_TEGGR|nr:hypothetical protein KUTeg_013176 [Tegillarca granosa]